LPTESPSSSASPWLARCSSSWRWDTRFPSSFTPAIAEILAYVYELGGKIKLQEGSIMSRHGVFVTPIRELAVPSGHRPGHDDLCKKPAGIRGVSVVAAGITLFRLVLNVATTRLILTAGDRYPTPEEAMHAAGEVVNTFSELVNAGSLAVGIIIFIIIFVIQFVVITKGATRISEVAARFTLDAMPGKQMAIDADLNAGNITEPQARQRRARHRAKPTSTGPWTVPASSSAATPSPASSSPSSMSSAASTSAWSSTTGTIMDCLQLYTKLTIGDGLVSQIPRIRISLGAGLIVTRTSSKKNLGDEMLSQVFAKPKALVIAAVFLGLMMRSPAAQAPCCSGRLLRRPWPGSMTRNEKKGRRHRFAAKTRKTRQERAGKSREAARSRHDGARSRLRPGASWSMPPRAAICSIASA
jgi:hypothetical protein